MSAASHADPDIAAPAMDHDPIGRRQLLVGALVASAAVAVPPALASAQSPVSRKRGSAMPIFVTYVRFKKSREEVLANAKAHDAWLERYIAENKMIVSGGWKDEAGKIIGGIIVFRDLTRDQLEQALKDEPFVKNDIVDVTIDELNPLHWADGFAPFVGKH